MKKIVTFILALVMVFTLVACGGTPSSPQPAQGPSDSGPSNSGASDPGASEPAGSTDEPLRIGFANASVSNSWRVKMRDMLVEAADELGVVLVESDAHDDANTQISNIEAMLQQNLDAILITPAMEDAVNAGIEAAYAAGIPVILFDRTATTEDYHHFVGWTDENNGAACAQMIVDALTEKYGEPRGTVVALDSIAGSGTDNGQKAGQDSVFSQYPNIEIIARQYTDFEESKGKAAMEDFLSRFPSGEIDAVISQDGPVSMAAWDAIVEAGREDDGIIFVNADGVNGICRLIKEGKFYGCTQFPCAASVEALKLAIATLEGSDPDEKIVIMDPIVVTAANVDDYLIVGGDDFDWTY